MSRYPKKPTGEPAPRIDFDPRLRFMVPEAAQLLRLSRATVYLRIKAGTIRTIKEGKRRYIPGSEIARLCEAPAA